MPSIFQAPAEAYAEIDNRLKQKIEADDELLINLSALNDEDLAEVRKKWDETQTKQMRIQTGSQTRKAPIAPGAAFGAASRGAAELGQDVTNPVTRPLYDPGTENFLAAYAEDPSIFNWQEANQQELEGGTSLLLQAFPDKAPEILGHARTRANEILRDRGAILFPEADDEGNLTKIAMQESTRQLTALAGAAGGSTFFDLASKIASNPLPLTMAGLPKIDADRSPEATAKREAAGREVMNRISTMSEENRRLSQLAYAQPDILAKVAGTGLAWLGGANALFRRSISQNYVDRIDQATGLKVLDRAGRQARDIAPLKVNPVSVRGLGEGAIYDAAVGGALGPEYAPSLMAEAIGMEPSRFTAALESGAIGAIIGTAMRQLANSPSALRQARQMPGMEQFKDAPNDAFRLIFRREFPKILEAERMKRHDAYLKLRRESIPTDTASMGGEFVGDVAESAKRPIPQLKQWNAPPPAAPAPVPAKPAAPAPAPAADPTGRIAKMTRAEFEKEYKTTFETWMKYTPQQAGANVYAAKLADLADVHPKWVEEIEAATPRPPGAGQVAPPAEGAPGSSVEAAGKVKFGDNPDDNKRPKRKSVGYGADGQGDLLNAIEDLGGIRSPRGLSKTGGEYDGFMEVFNVMPLRNLVYMKHGENVDQMVHLLNMSGYDFGSIDEFYIGVERARKSRQQLAAQAKLHEEQNVFFNTALDNKGGRRTNQKPSEDEITPVDELKVGDEFYIKGEKIKVKDIDPDNWSVIVDDGPRFGTNIELPSGATVHPDKGTLKRAEISDEFLEPEDLAAFNADQEAKAQAKAPADNFNLERATPEQMEAETAALAETKAREAQQAQLLESQQASLTGDSSDVGQGKLFDEDADLFSGPSAESMGPPDVHRTIGSPFQDTAPPPAGSRSLPDWVKAGGETREGKRLVKGIESPGKRPDFGPRSIINFVNQTLDVEMRRLRSQTSKRHPAHYRPVGHVTVTRSTLNGNWNFHEAAHGMKELIEARTPGWFDQAPQSEQLIALTKRADSMASAKNTHEGVAEWVRMRIIHPAEVEGLPISRALEEKMREFLPGVDAALRDAARAWERFQRQPASVRWEMVNRDIGETGTLRLANILDVLSERIDTAVGTFSSGSVWSALDRRIYSATVKHRREIDKTYNEVQKVARQTRKEFTNPLLMAHNNVLNISSEVQNALTGTGPFRGLRILGKDRNYQIIHQDTWNDIRRRIPGKLWNKFQHAGWARETLDRYEKLGHTYPGDNSGITPEDLRQVIFEARRDIPNFDKHFSAVQAYFDAVLEIKELGGLKKAGEVERMKARGQYWPLPRILETPQGMGRGGNHANISAGDHKARGSNEPLRDLNEVAEFRTREAYDRHYYNELARKIYHNLLDVATNANLPMAARAIAGRPFLRLMPEMKIAATISKKEGRKIVFDGMMNTLAKQLGVPKEKVIEDMNMKPEDINLAWEYKDLWRPAQPSEINVMSFVENGERIFVQVKDPMMFQYFANNGQPGKLGKMVEWGLLPMARNVQRLITQNPIFAILSNPQGDIFNQMMMNRDAISFVPGGASALGMWNKFSNKYPQVFDKGLLMSRSQPSSIELVNEMRHTRAWQFMMEGVYLSRHPNRLVRWASNALQPTNLLYPLIKAGDIVNLGSGGRYAAPRLEGMSREGAAVYVKMQGGTDEEAMFAYWNATGPFNEHPGNGDLKVMTQTAIFTNPMIQALRRGAQNLTDPDPVVAASSWAKLGIIGSVAAASATAGYLMMTEEEKETERERRIEDRISHYTVKGIRLRHPLGPEGAVHSFIYNATMDHWLDFDRDRKPGREASLYLRRIASWDGGPIRFFGPQVQAATEASMNWSPYYQRNIVSPWMANLPASEQYSAQTPEFYKKLGQWFNYSPDKIQHIMRQGISRQTDEIINLLGRMDTGRPMQERADIPFVGRAFVRDPIGFGSRSVAELAEVEAKINLLELRLQAKGFSQIEVWPEGVLTPETRALRTQIEYLRALRKGAAQIQEFTELAKTYGQIGDYQEERNLRFKMVDHAQRVLLYNREGIDNIDEALKQIRAMEPADPDHHKQDILMRRLQIKPR